MRQLDGVAGSPWFLGERFSALDLYIAVMTHWRPGRKWFAVKTPKLMAIAEKTAAIPKVAAVLEKNFS
jgi:GST-like protein